MSGLDWIAALLAPADVAPHPNFMTQETILPSGLVGLLAQGRFVEFQRLIRPTPASEEPKFVLDENVPEHRIVAAAVASIEAATQHEGAESLAQLATDERLALGARTAAALLASLAFGELDQVDRAVDLLVLLEGALSRTPAADARFLTGLVCQQLALRRSDSGADDVISARRSFDLLTETNPATLSSFRTSQGVSWTSVETLEQIRDQVVAAADAYLLNADPDSLLGDGWQRMVRRRPPELGLRLTSATESAYWAYLEADFERVANVQGMRFQNGDPVDSPLYATLIHYELLGDASATRKWRSRLSVTRFLRHSSDEAMMREALRLARQSEDQGVLQKELRAVQLRGPLRALRADALQVLAARGTPERLRVGELTTLEYGAAVLSPAEASMAMDAVLAAIDSRLPGTMRRWQLFGVRAERAWMALVELAITSSRLTDAAATLLRVTEDPEATDAIFSQGLARAVGRIDWDQVESAVQEGWARRVRGKEDSLSVALRQAIGPELDVHLGLGPHNLSLGTLAELLNLTFKTSEPPAIEVVDSAVALVRGQLETIRREAARGSFGFGGIQVADIAAGMALHWDTPLLWEPLAEFISDPRVNAGDKTSALERLASVDSRPPADFIASIGEHLQSLLRSSPIDPFGTDTCRAAALRFGIRHGLLTESTILGEVSLLLGSTDVDDRMEAARCFGLLARMPPYPDWAAAISYQLAHDRDLEVRAEAGRALGSVMGAHSPLAPLVEEAVLELLGTDGLITPLLTLRGLLAGTSITLSGAVRRRVEALRDAHLAHGVRMQAAAVLAKEPVA